MGEADESEVKPKARGRVRRWVIGIVAVVAIAACGYAGYAIWVGDIAPSDAAAKYSGFNYLPENEVTDYIGVYREQMGLAQSSDEDWATFLAAYNLTPARLRYSTIRQLLTDKLVQMRADELGIQVTDSEIDATLDTLKGTMALGSDEVWQETLAARGQTEEGVRDVYRQAILKRQLLSQDVAMPEPSDEQVKEYMKTFDSTLASPTVKHTYCFKWTGVDENTGLDVITMVQNARNELVKNGLSEDAFAAVVEEYSNDEELKGKSGANGWNADTSAYSEEYLSRLEGLGEGEISDVFKDGDAYEFIWVNMTYDLPTDSDAIDSLDLSMMPSSLEQYLRDSEAYELWEDECDEYLSNMLENAGVVYYPMPADVPYNVDMSLADVQLEEVEEGEGGGE